MRTRTRARTKPSDARPRRTTEPLRTATKLVLRQYGVATSSLRADPQFLLIGGKRCGTTSMYNYLVQHPRILPLFPRAQKIKGVHYFDSNYGRGEAWYRSHFPLRWRLGRPPDNAISGEASPYYLFHPLAPQRAHRSVPDAKLLVLLRNPVDRAWSHHRERTRHGAETLDFEAALDAEDERLDGEEERILAGGGYCSQPHEDFSYVLQGRYVDALERWLALYPRQQVLVVISEHMFARSGDAYDDIVRFLGLPPARPTTFDRWNYHAGSSMPAAVRRRLLDRFAPDNRRLEELLGVDLSVWDI